MPSSSPLRRNLRRGLQGNDSIHENVAKELDASDKDGLQGGQKWNAPTQGPTGPPTTRAPTWSPTSHPTLGGIQWQIRGAAWYDRNANGIQDSNVAVDGYGRDVEFSHGLGAVNLQLVQCDNTTGRAYVAQEGETLKSFAGGRTQGVDVQGKARIGPQLGKFEIHLVQGHALDRYYYLQAQVPSNADKKFFFTSGVCNDAVTGWECDYPNQPAPAPPADADVPLGIPEGRTPGCVFVDKSGNVDQLVNFGIGREGDTREVGADVALVLEFDDQGTAPKGVRRLDDLLGRAKAIDMRDEGGRVTTRYLLAERDKADIGTVTAEVLAAAIDARLEDNGIELDSVNPKDVFFSSQGDGSSQLAVAMEIRGHYSPPPEIDFDYIVQDSINQDTTTIRRGLREYNRNCNNQWAKVQDEGYVAEDFDARVSTSGVKRGQKKNLATTDNVFSTACSTDILVPEYFETSLKEVGARDKNALKALRDVVVTLDEGSGFADWAVGPVAGISGLIMLLMGLFVFRRVLGVRHVTFSDTIKEVDGDEARRFGEAGGDLNDNSAYYSESDSDVEETEKERRMRHKMKEKANEPRRPTYKEERVQAKVDSDNSKPRRKNRAARPKTLVSSLKKSFTKSSMKKSTRDMIEEGKPLAVSRDSDTSEELSGSAREREEFKMKPSAKKPSSSSDEKLGGSKRRARKGRRSQRGGDDAEVYDDSRLI